MFGKTKLCLFKKKISYIYIIVIVHYNSTIQSMSSSSSVVVVVVDSCDGGDDAVTGDDADDADDDVNVEDGAGRSFLPPGLFGAVGLLIGTAYCAAQFSGRDWLFFVAAFVVDGNINFVPLRLGTTGASNILFIFSLLSASSSRLLTAFSSLFSGASAAGIGGLLLVGGAGF